MLKLVVLLLACATLALCDTPASCMYEDIRGVWTFSMDAGGKTKSEDCSGDIKFTRSYTVELAFPNIAIGPDGEKGTWTMIYNQGFEVWIGGRIFFAFSYYEEEDGKVKSYCSTTFGGWYHGVDLSDWGCYVGKKHGAMVLREVEMGHAETARQAITFQNDHEFIDAINSQQSLWTAAAYPHMEESTIGELEEQAGLPYPVIQSEMLEELERAGPLQTIDDVFTNDEVAFDWRNVSGVNYDSPVRNQGKCGSCYSFASMAVLESRIRIKTNNKEKPILSPQDAVSCSEYAQGCSGGFNYLIAGKYAYDFGVVEESCFPYTANDTPCSQRCKSPNRVWRAKSYGYIGGFWGACNEPLMREEIRRNGPIAVAFKVYPDFRNYKSGIYHHVEATTFNPFQETSHAVVLVGWGEERGIPYWIAKNSWGPEWGENGYFKIVRGVNNCAIESMGFAAEVDV